MKSIWIILLLVLASALSGVYYVVRPSLHHEDIPAILRVGVLPDESPEVISERYQPLLDYLSDTTGLQTRLIIPEDYDALVRLFRAHALELAYFGGLTYVQANNTHDAEALVMRDVDSRFTSWFVVRGDEPAQGLADFRGKRFSFGSELSTSGHLMPRHFLRGELQAAPEDYFSAVHYSGSHDRTAFLVRDGEVDLGAANSQIVKAMIRDGRLREHDLRVLWETPPYTDYVWAVHPHMNPNLKTRLRDAFLGLNDSDPVHSQILTGLGTQTFLPAGDKDYRDLMQIATNLGMLEPGS